MNGRTGLWMDRLQRPGSLGHLVPSPEALGAVRVPEHHVFGLKKQGAHRAVDARGWSTDQPADESPARSRLRQASFIGLQQTADQVVGGLFAADDASLRIIGIAVRPVTRQGQKITSVAQP